MSSLVQFALDPEILAYGLNLAAAVSLVCGAGLLAAHLCRRRSAPLRHGILAAVMVLTLLCPAALWLGQQNGFALFRIAAVGSPSLNESAAGRAAPAADVVPLAPTISRESPPAPLADAHANPFIASEHSRTPPINAAAAEPHESVWDGLPASSLSIEEAEQAGQSLQGDVEARPQVPWWRLVGSLVVYAWAIGVVVAAFRLAWGFVVLWRFRRSMDRLADGHLATIARQAAAALRLRSPPPILLCRFTPAPVSLGLLRPAVVLPSGIMQEMDRDQVEAVLIHEIGHIVRGDRWVGLVQRLATMLFWWNPLVRWTSRGVSDVREDICDNYVLRVQGSGDRLARTLVDIAARTTVGAPFASAVGVLQPGLAGLAARIQRLMNKNRTNETSMNLTSRLLIWTCGLAAIAVLGLAGGLVVVRVPEATAADASGETAAVAERPATGDVVPNAADNGQRAADDSPVKDLAELIRRVRHNEELLQDLDVTLRTVRTYAVPDPPSTIAAKTADRPQPAGAPGALPYRMMVEEVGRAVTQNDRIYFSGEEVTSLSSGEKLRGKWIAVFDGTQTVSIEEGNCVTVHQGRYAPSRLSRPHCWGLFHLPFYLPVDSPLSVYLEGTEAMKSHPMARPRPGEPGSAYVPNKVESQYTGEEVIDGLACVKVRVRHWYLASDPPTVRDLWLAKERNFHVARCRTVLVGKDQEVPYDETRVAKWRELAKGVWLPEVVEWRNISPEKERRSSESRRLVLDKAVWRPKLPEGFFRLPEIPAGLPKYVINADGRLADSPFHPVAVTAAEKTTLPAILKRLAEEEKRYDQIEAVTTTRYQLLQSPYVGISGMTQRSTTRQRSVMAGERLYYQEDRESASAGGTSSSETRQAYDGRWLRELTRYISLRGPDAKPEVHAGLRLGGLEDMRLLRAHNILLQHPDNRQSLAGFLASGWLDRECRNRMTVEYAGDERVGDLYCHKLKCELPHQGSKTPSNAFFIWLARDRNLLLVRHEWREPARSERLPTGIRYVDELREIRPGVWFPFHATSLAHRNQSGDGLDTNNILLQWREDTKVESLTLDPQVDEKLFTTVEVPEGAPIDVRDEQGEYIARLKQPKTGNLELSLDKFRAMRQEAAANEDDQEDPKDPTAPARKKRIDAALVVLRRTPPATQEERIEASLEILRSYRIFETNTKKWALAIRTLIETGKPAIAKLIWELDHTDHLADRGNELRALGYALRGIGDPRAVPALIRALPQTLQPPGSDCGMGIHFDPEFLKFMQRHDKVQTEAGSSFSYGRPINEVLTALQKLTGETGIVPGEKDNQEFKDIRQVFRDWPEGRPEENRKKPTLFLRFAEHWADWWSKNWRSFVKDEAEAQLDQTKQTLERLSRRT